MLVEKPLAIDVKHGEHLVSLAKANGRILMVGHILRYHPAILKLQELIRSGALGKINYLYSNRLNIGKIRTEENISVELRSSRHLGHAVAAQRDADARLMPGRRVPEP